jgi:hypothetical protein
MVVVLSPHSVRQKDNEDIGTRLPGRRQYKGAEEIVKRGR